MFKQLLIAAAVITLVTPSANAGSLGYGSNVDPMSYQPPSAAGQSMPKLSRAEIAHQIRIHTRKRNLIAAKLNAYWKKETEISNERDRYGRSGDMQSVQDLDGQLYSLRQTIDQLRAQLT